MIRSDPDAGASVESRVRWLAVAGAVFALTGVAAGAFGAHALKSWLPPQRIAEFDTAVRYQGLHALALFATAWVFQTWPGRVALASGACFAAGTLLFCGSLYALALLDEPWVGILTPIGGIGFLAGWTFLAIAIVKSKKRKDPVR